VAGDRWKEILDTYVVKRGGHPRPHSGERPFPQRTNYDPVETGEGESDSPDLKKKGTGGIRPTENTFGPGGQLTKFFS